MEFEVGPWIVFTGRYGLNVYMYAIHVNLNLRLSQPVSHRLITAEAGVWCQVSPHETCGAQSGTGTGFSAHPSVSPVSIIPPMLHSHLHLHVALRLYWLNQLSNTTNLW